MHKTTVLRLARTLAQSHYMVQTEAGHWRLGRQPAGSARATRPASTSTTWSSRRCTSWCGSRAKAHRSMCARATSTLRGARRRPAIGAAQRAHRRAAAAGPWRARPRDPRLQRREEPYESIRSRGYQLSMGEREAEVSSVAAPVFRTGWHLLGSMCISGPSSRLTRPKLENMRRARWRPPTSCLMRSQAALAGHAAGCVPLGILEGSAPLRGSPSLAPSALEGAHPAAWRSLFRGCLGGV